jgi:hypothetical protein
VTRVLRTARNACRPAVVRWGRFPRDAADEGAIWLLALPHPDRRDEDDRRERHQRGRFHGGPLEA